MQKANENGKDAKKLAVKKDYSKEVNERVIEEIKTSKSFLDKQRGPQRLVTLKHLMSIDEAELKKCSNSTRRKLKSVIKTAKDTIVADRGIKFTLLEGYAVSTDSAGMALALLGCDYITYYTPDKIRMEERYFPTVFDKAIRLNIYELLRVDGLPWKVRFTSYLPEFSQIGDCEKYVYSKHDQNLMEDRVRIGMGFFGVGKYGSKKLNPKNINGLVTVFNEGGLQYNLIVLAVVPFPCYLETQSVEHRPKVKDDCKTLDDHEAAYFQYNINIEDRYNRLMRIC